MIVDLRTVRRKRVITVGLKKLIEKMKWDQGTPFFSAIKLDEARNVDPDLPADIEKV